MSDVDALIVDMDGVIRHWDQEHFASTVAQFGLEVREFAALAFETKLLESAMVGAITFEQWADEIGNQVSAHHGADPVAVSDAFQALTWKIDLDVVALLREVRAVGQAKVALFSNASTRLEADLDSESLQPEFDIVFNSARLGVAKPSPDAFRRVAELLEVPLEKCLFVDDTLPNVDGARTAGMQAEAFTGVAALRSLLERAGLLGAASAS